MQTTVHSIERVFDILDYRRLVVAAVSVVWNTFTTAITFENLVPHVLEAARQISLRLGCTNYPAIES